MEWILSSSVLTAAVLLLRKLFDGRVSRRLQYSLWLLVLIRLLVPGSIAQSAVSVADMLARQDAVRQVSTQLRTPTESYESAMAEVLTSHSIPQHSYAQLPQPQQEALREEAALRLEQTAPAHTLKQVLTAVWLAGMGVTAAWITLCNFLFHLRLKTSRRRLDAGAQLPVYASGAVRTPCLCGLFRPAIYLPEEAAAGSMLPMVLRHELTHHRHGDHVWSAARCLCLALHWYNPLVWLAARASRQDGELACDEGVLQGLSQEERTCYGHALIQMSCATSTARDFVLTATTMTGDKKTLYRRVQSIARRPKFLLSMVAMLLAAVLIAAGCTFTGIRDSDADTTPTETTAPAETTQPTTPSASTQPTADTVKEDAREMLDLLKVKLAELMYVAKAGDDRVFPLLPNGYAYIGNSYETDRQLPTGNGHAYLLPHNTPLYASPEDPYCVYYQVEGGYRRLTQAGLLYDAAEKPGATYQTAFFSTLLRPAAQNIYHQAAGQNFTDPADVDLGLLFYNGFPQWNHHNVPLSEAEAQFLRSKGWGSEMPLSNATRFPISAMDAQLRQYLGIGFEDTNKVGLEQMDYFPDTRCYYTWRSDTRGMELTVLRVDQDEQDLLYLVTYEIAGAGRFCMHLQYADGVYRILQNTPQ